MYVHFFKQFGFFLVCPIMDKCYFVRFNIKVVYKFITQGIIDIESIRFGGTYI